MVLCRKSTLKPSCPPSERVASNGRPQASDSATVMPPGLPTTMSAARK